MFDLRLLGATNGKKLSPYGGGFFCLMCTVQIKVKSAEMPLTKRQQEILDISKNILIISRRELSKNFGINQSAIQNHIDALKENNYLERIGGTRGYWNITTKDN
jgi:predicted HTH transcriptional regulator|tara:strand:- start:103 stop:414 length:312 start_codon:yes stop_codon:yes gene_type:complete